MKPYKEDIAVYLQKNGASKIEEIVDAFFEPKADPYENTAKFVQEYQDMENRVKQKLRMLMEEQKVMSSDGMYDLTEEELEKRLSGKTRFGKMMEVLTG
jgi:hypothetical protein